VKLAHVVGFITKEKAEVYLFSFCYFGVLMKKFGPEREEFTGCRMTLECV
jgi:hypothetical protein